MKLFKRMKDGGPESKVEGFWLVEIKSMFSIVLLHFSDGSREAYHSHAFNALSWVLKGALVERVVTNRQALRERLNKYAPSLNPIYTRRSMFHNVVSVGDTWVLSFRGPWADKWKEFLPNENKFITLTHGRKVMAERG